MICPECYWEQDSTPGGSEYGPNRVFLKEARANYILYRACDPHGYWCKHYRDLPEGVANGERLACLAWRLASRCYVCDVYTGVGVPCPECGE